jgi:hypothetical protein
MSTHAGHPLLEGWAAAQDAEGRVYYFNAGTGETSWVPPYVLPEGWAAHQDAEGRTFYACAATGETSWEPPAVTLQVTQDEWDTQIVEAVKKWFMETEMEQLFHDAAAFADQHCEVFEPQVGEHKLVYTQLHEEYKQLFMDKLTAFLASLGQPLEAFEVAFEKMIKRDADAQGMAELMYCALDYEFFCQLMSERKKEFASRVP